MSAVVPITLVASAWGVAIAATPGSDTIDAKVDSHSDHGTPPISDVPTDAFTKPSFGKVQKHQSSLAPLASFSKKQATPMALKSSPLPSAAVSAYRDAAKVMANVKSACKLDWTLVAAIGRVESDHGRYGGSTLDTRGDSSPEIIGIPLNGSNNTAAIRDTDNGQFDGDTTWDRAVGPMQFIPSTWNLVGVDGNGDGVKSPHNIYDAALATAVYLCADNDDLSTKDGASAAVYSYNHSNEYVANVLAIADRYKDGDFTEESTVYLPDTPDSDDELFDPDTYDPGPSNDDQANQGNNSNQSGGARNQLEPKTTKPKNGDGGPQQLKPVETGGSDQDNGPKSQNDVGAAQPDNDNELKPQVNGGGSIGGGAIDGKPGNVDGTNKPDDIQGFADDKSGSQQNTKPNGPGVDIRPEQVGPKSKNGTHAKPKKGTVGQVQTKPKSQSESGPKHKAPKRPKGAVTIRPKQENSAPKHKAPKTTKPKTTAPKTTKPKTTAPKTTKPKTTAPKTTKPKTTAPKTTKPKTTAPKTTKPKAVKPKNSAAVTEACTVGSEEIQEAGNTLTDKQSAALVSDCVDNSQVVWSEPSDDPVLEWMEDQVAEL
ncbi:lytic murein transglycosylase [Nocardioidaceae bacterium SCSIO 66511]|nr:lytic murein transglycosylase [Nocardioidaceae bacterium SCSIO 66511]